MLVFADDDGVTFATGGAFLFLRDGHWRDFRIKVTRLLRRHGFELGSQRHLVLIFSRDVVVFGHVFSRLGHGIYAILFLHQLVDKAPANGGVVHLRGAAEGAFGLAHDIGCPAHTFNATRYHHASFTRFDGAGCSAYGIQTRTTQAVNRRAWQLHGQPGQQRCHVGNVAVVFAGLVNATVNHIGHGQPIDAGVARHQRFERDCP